MALQSEFVEQRATRAALIVPIIVAALPSLVLLAVLPPVYGDMTIVGIVHNPAAAMPHYPPLYGYFLWSVHQVTHLFGAPAGTSDAGVMLMALIQQAVLVAAIVYFATACSSTLLGRVLAIAPFYVLIQFAIINLGLQTEALWLSSLIFLFGAGIRIVRAGSITRWTALALFLSFAMSLMLRPTGLFFAPIVPGALLLVALLERRRGPAIAALLSVLIMGAGFVTSNLVFRAAMAANGMEYTSPWGRGTTEAIQRLFWRMEDGDGLPKRDRTTLIPRLQQKAGNDRLREAVPTLVTYLDKTYDGTGKSGNWGGAQTALIRNGFAANMAQADKLVNEFCALFIRAFPGLMFSETRSTLSMYGQAMLRSGPYNFSNLIAATRVRDAALHVFRDQPAALSVDMKTISMNTRNAEYLAKSDRFRANPYVAWLSRTLAHWHLALTLVVAMAIGLWTRRLDVRSASFVIAGSIVMILYLAIVSLLLVFIWRYLLPIELFLGISLGLVAARIAPTPSERTHVDRSRRVPQFSISPS